MRFCALALTVLAINEYVNDAAAQRWKAVAAFALEDLGGTSRAGALPR